MKLASGRTALALSALFLLEVAFFSPACSLLVSTDGAVGGGSASSSSATTASSTASGSGGSGAADAGSDALAPPPFVRTQTEAELAPQRAACAFGPGAWPASTIGTDYPLGDDIPIKHIIVIIQENRAFDHYLGRLVAQGYYNPGDFTTSDAGVPGTGFQHSDQLDGPPPGWSNTDTDGTVVTPHADNEYCYGVDHSWEGQHNDWDNGKNDRFVVQNDPDGSRALFYEDDSVIPFYYALASTFSVGDRYFCSVLGPTWPNRFFAMAATSFGLGDNSFCPVDTATSPAPQIFSLLAQGGHTWKDYTDGPHQTSFFPYFGFSPACTANLANVKCGLLGDIANNTLPDVAYVMGDEVDEDSDEGPSDLPGIGGQLVEQILRTLFASPAWQDTVVFITYDENGGLADHVPPAPACAPDNYPAMDGDGTPLVGGFTTTGFRVPFIAISPYAKAHFVSHTVHDHTSIVRFIESRFGLPAMTARDANATPPMEMFDFKNPPFMTPPNITAHTTVPPQILSSCGQKLAPLTCSSSSP